MPNKEEVYAIWAPPESLWSRWVKPVMFSFIGGNLEKRAARSFHFQSGWVPAPASTAIILDLPAEEGILWGLKLAEMGYTPVPLYNALPFPASETPFAPELRPRSAVDVQPILAAIIQGAEELQRVALGPSAPPAFLLDAERRLARTDLGPGVFDNRSVCFTTDFPSADFLLQHGITSVVVVHDNAKFAHDLLEILALWQQRGIQILRKSRLGTDLPVAAVVKRPSFLSTMWFRLGVALGLRRAELGGFGGIVPASSG
jgi:hypothetical protein